MAEAEQPISTADLYRFTVISLDTRMTVSQEVHAVEFKQNTVEARASVSICCRKVSFHQTQHTKTMFCDR